MPALRTAVIALALGGTLAAATTVRAQDPAARQRCNRAGDARSPEARGALEADARGTGEAARFARACLAHAAGRYDEAVREFEQLAGEHATSAVYPFYLGRAYGAQAQRANVLRKAGLARKVKAAFERAVQLDPDYLDAREGLMQYYVQAPGIMGGSETKAREQAYEVRKRNAYRGGLLYAFLAARAKDQGGAIRELETLARAYPDSTSPHTQLAVGHADRRQWAEGWAAVDRMQRALPDAPATLYAVGRMAATSGQQLDRGAAALGRYLQRTPASGEPTLAGAHWRLGAILEHQGQRDRARAEYEAALRLEPGLTGARDALARVR